MDSENVEVKSEGITDSDSEHSTPDDARSDYDPENDSETPMKKRRSCTSRLVQKLSRMKGNWDKKALRNARERENYRRRIANETPEKREIRLQKQKLRERHRRKMQEQREREVPKEITRQHVPPSERYRRRIANETPEQREQRLQKLRELHRRKMQRLREAPKEITRQHAIQRERYRRRMANETPEEKEKRLQNLRNLHNRRIQRLKEAETPEEAAMRHARQREKYKRKIASETPEEREIRLQKLRELHSRRTQRLREDETPEEREEREGVEADVRQLIGKCETDEQRRARRRGLAADWIGVKRHKRRHPLTVNLQDHDFHCELCSTTIIMRFRYISHLHHHINRTGLLLDIHEPIVLYICDFTGCHLCFRDKGRYVGHLESHSSTRSTFNCSVCRKPFAMETNCENHVELAHGAEAADYVDCEYCHLVVKKEDGEAHFVTHQIRLDEKEANHICETCGKGFKQLSTMKTHIRVVHAQPKPVDRTPRTKRSEMILKKRYNTQPCVVCDKLLTNKKDLDQHMLRNHTYEHGTECFECGKRLRYLHTLHSHIRRWHRKEPLLHKRAKCKFCPRDFSSYFLKNKHHFIDHRQEYLRERPFCCGVCFRNFARKDIFMNHLLVHDRFKCPVCFLRSVSISTHDEHISSHNIGPLAPTRTRKRHRNLQIRKFKKQQTVTINTIFVDQSEKEIIEGTNHYFHRDDGWHVIPSDLSSQLSQNSIEQGEAHVEDTVEPEAHEDQNFYYYEEADQPDQSDPQSAGYGARVESIPVPGPSRQFLEDFQRTIPEAESQSETLTLAEYQDNPASTEKPKKYKCDRCPLQFNYPKYLLIHIAWHVGNETKNVEVVATPSVAVQTVLSKNPTELELAKYRNPDYEEPEHAHVIAKRHVCPECAQLFHHLPKLNDHRRNKHGVHVEHATNSISCEFCPSTFTRQYLLRRHIQLLHPSTIQAKSTVDNSTFEEEDSRTSVRQDSRESKDTVSCKLCSISYTRIHYLNRHMEMVHTPKPLRNATEGFNTNLKEENPWTPEPSQDFEDMEVNTGSDEEQNAEWKPAIIQAVNSRDEAPRKSRRASTRTKSTRETSRSSSSSSKVQDKWTCGECPMAFIRESALKQHKLTHEAARATMDYDFEEPEWILPDIKMEPQDDDEEDPEWQNDSITIPIQNSDDEEDTEEVRPSIQLSTLRQLKMRTTRSMSKLAPHLKQAAESLPSQVVVKLPRVEDSKQRRSPKVKIKEEFQETPEKPKTTRKYAKRRPKSKTRKAQRVSSRSSSPTMKSTNLPPKPKRRKKGMGRKPGDICDICGKVLHPNTSLEAHLATHSQVKSFKCDICSRTYGHEKQLKIHRARIHLEVLDNAKWTEMTKKHTCPVCGKLIKTKSLLEPHIASHSGVLPFQCDVCNKKFPHERQMNAHKSRNHLENPPPRKSQKGLTLIKKPGFEYMRSDYYCDVCYKTLKHKSRFDRHMRIHFDTHPELETLIHMYHCDACPQAFRLHDHFLSHLMTHSIAESSSPIICNVCNKAFAKGSNLETHTKNVHETFEAVFDCDHCHCNFKQEGDLRIHEKAHAVDLAASLDGSQMCPHCGQTFKLHWYLNVHILQAHDGVGLDPDFKLRKDNASKPDGKVGNNKFAPCQVCGEKFGVRRALKSHLLKDHTYEHGVICYVCGKRFTILGHLNRHLREFHKDDEQLAIHALPKVSKTGHRTAYSCPHCPVVYYGGTLRLNKHLFRIHHEEYMQGKPIYCQLCFKNFATEEELVAHRPAHNGIKCDRCGEQFLRMAFLNKHMLRCTGKPGLAVAGGKRRGRRNTAVKAQNSHIQRELEMERSSTENSPEGEDYEDNEDRPVYEFMEVQPPVSTHSLGLVEHPVPLNLVQQTSWSSHTPSTNPEQLQFSMESYLHWN